MCSKTKAKSRGSSIRETLSLLLANMQLAFPGAKGQCVYVALLPKVSSGLNYQGLENYSVQGERQIPLKWNNMHCKGCFFSIKVLPPIHFSLRIRAGPHTKTPCSACLVDRIAPPCMTG